MRRLGTERGAATPSGEGRSSASENEEGRRGRLGRGTTLGEGTTFHFDLQNKNQPSWTVPGSMAKGFLFKKPNRGIRGAVDDRFVNATRAAFRSWLLTTAPTPVVPVNLLLYKRMPRCALMARVGRALGFVFRDSGGQRHNSMRARSLCTRTRWFRGCACSMGILKAALCGTRTSARF